MVIFCAILPVPPQADPAPRPDGEDVAKGVLEPREGVDGRAPRISSGLEGLRYSYTPEGVGTARAQNF